MNLLLTESWSFGMSELINSIAAFLTFVAICVSLYLAQKSKTLKFKVLGKKINKKAFQEHQYQQINILNNGHTKFTCTSIGYYINKKYYFVDYIQGLKKLDTTIIEQKAHNKHHITTENVILPTYVQEGDILQTGLWPADYNFDDIKKNCRVYIFVLINGKVHKFYTGYKYKKFAEEIKIFDEQSLYNQGHKLHSIKSKGINDDYFR